MEAFLWVTIPATLLALLYNGLCGLTGYFLVRLSLGPEPGSHFSSRLSLPVLSLALGQAVLGGLFQILAALFIFWPTVVFGGFGLLAVAGFILWRPWARGSWPAAHHPRSSSTELAEPVLYLWPVAVALAYLLLMSWVRAFGWPDGDAMAFYLAQPKLIAHVGGLIPLPSYHLFAEIGLFVEMHIAAIYLLADEMAARAWLWQSGLVLALAVAALTVEVGSNRSAATLAAAAVLTSTAVVFLMISGKTDHVSAAWAVAALVSAQTVRPDNRQRPVFLAALLGSLASFAKLSFIPVFVPVLATVVLFRLAGANVESMPHASVRRASFRPLARRVLAVAPAALSGALLAFFPLAAKNMLVFGQPLAPFFYLGGGSSEVLFQIWFAPEHTRWILWTYPLALTIGKYPMQFGNVTPLLLALPPVLVGLWLLRQRLPRPAVVLALGGVAGVILWMVLRPSVLAPRYILPALVCILPLLTTALDLWLRRYAGVISGFVVVLALFWSIILMGYRYTDDWPRTQLYATDQKPDYLLLAGEALNEAARPGDRFLLATYYTSFLSGEVLRCSLGQKELEGLSAPLPKTPREMWTRLYRNRVGGVLMHRPTHSTLLGQEADPAAAPPWLTVHEIEMGALESVFLLEWSENAPPQEVACPPLSAAPTGAQARVSSDGASGDRSRVGDQGAKEQW